MAGLYCPVGPTLSNPPQRSYHISVMPHGPYAKVGVDGNLTRIAPYFPHSSRALIDILLGQYVVVDTKWPTCPRLPFLARYSRKQYSKCCGHTSAIPGYDSHKDRHLATAAAPPAWGPTYLRLGRERCGSRLTSDADRQVCKTVSRAASWL